MNEYLTTEENFDLPETNDTFQEILQKYQSLEIELETVKKEGIESQERQFELNNQIKILKFENKNLKQTIINYQDLIESYKSSIDTSEVKDVTSTLIQTNLDILQKVTEIEKRNFILEKEKEDMEKTIQELEAELKYYSTNIQTSSNTNNTNNTNPSQRDNSALRLNGFKSNGETSIDLSLSTLKMRPCKSTKNLYSVTLPNTIQFERYKDKIRFSNATTQSSKNSNFNFDENDVKNVLQEIEDLKKEKAEISERALNMLTEKELTILELRSLFDEIKEKNEQNINLIKYENTKKKNLGNQKESLTFSESTNLLESNSLDPENSESYFQIKYQKLEDEFQQLQNFYNENEKSWLTEKEKLNTQLINQENSHSSHINDLQTEILKLRNEISLIELEKNSLNRQLDKDKTTIETEMDQYHYLIKNMEEQKISDELSYKSQINILKTEIRELDSINKNLRDNFANLEKKLGDLEKVHLKKMESIEKNFRLDQREKDEEIMALKQNHVLNEKEKEDFKKECEKYKSINESTKNNYKDLLNQLKNLKEGHEMEVHKWKENFEDLKKISETEKSSLNNKIKELNIQIEEYETKICARYEESTYTGNKKKFHSRHSKSLVISLQDYDSDENLDLLKDKIQTLQGEIKKLSSLNKLKENNSHNVFRLNGEIQNLKKENEKLKKELSELKEKLELSEKENNELKLKNANKNPPLTNDPQSHNKFSKLEIHKLEERLKRLSIENKFLTEQIEIAKKELDNTIKIKDDHIVKLKSDLMNADKNLDMNKLEFSKIIKDKDGEITKYVDICKKLRMKYVNIKYKNTDNFLNNGTGGKL